MPGGGFSLLNVLVLADLYNTVGEYEKAVRVIKTGSRWLQARGDQKYWDLVEDDREFELEGFSRTVLAGAGNGISAPTSLNPNPNSSSAPDGPAPVPSSSRTVGSEEVQPGYFPLDVNARHRLGVARIKMGDVNEGIVCASLPCLFSASKLILS